MREIFLMTVLVLLCADSASAETYAVDPAASTVKWEASKVTGRHEGHIEVSSGVIVFDGDRFTGGEAVVEAGSIVIDDIKDAESNAKLLRHLKSGDFFDAANHPQAMIKIINAESAGDGVYKVTAEVTIKGVTKPVVFPATVLKTPEGIQARAKIAIDRTDFGIRYGSGKFFENLGDRMIHDTFSLDVSITAA